MIKPLLNFNLNQYNIFCRIYKYHSICRLISISVTCLYLWTRTALDVASSGVSINHRIFLDGVTSLNRPTYVNQSEKRNISFTLYQDENTYRYSYGQRCSKKAVDVSFLKVHKAGSTTVMNIFLRFAIEHKLNIVLPRASKGFGFNYLGYGQTVARERIVPLPVNETYNILCNHVVYDKSAFHSLLPDDTKYIGIIREPVSQFKSAALYYGFVKNLGNIFKGISKEKVVSEFLKDPSKVKISTYFVHNKMSFDFGIPTQQFTNLTFIQSYIMELSKDYSVVLILEHLQESLVLMKRELCWSAKDILYVPLNAALKGKLTKDLDNVDIGHLKKWNSADVMLYEHFVETFKEKIGLQGDDFREEVENFRTMQGDVERFCKETARHNKKESVLTIPTSKWDNSFVVTYKDCVLMMENEEPMLKRLIENAWARYNASLTQK